MYQPRQEDFPDEAEDTDKIAQTLVVSIDSQLICSIRTSRNCLDAILRIHFNSNFTP